MNMPSAASEAWETGNTADNGAAPDPSSCDTGTSPAEWYRYIPQCGLAVPEVMITTCDDFTDFDTVISVWKQGPAGECPGTLVACNDDFIDPECQIGPVYRKSRVNFWALNGEVFYIRVSGYQRHRQLRHAHRGDVPLIAPGAAAFGNPAWSGGLQGPRRLRPCQSGTPQPPALRPRRAV